MNNSLGYRW